MVFFLVRVIHRALWRKMDKLSTFPTGFSPFPYLAAPKTYPHIWGYRFLDNGAFSYHFCPVIHSVPQLSTVLTVLSTILGKCKKNEYRTCGYISVGTFTPLDLAQYSN